MVSIIAKIGTQERRWDNFREIEESWVAEQLQRHRHAGQPTCVVLRLQTLDIRISLSTPNCGGGGGGRLPNSQEQRIIDLWQDRGLNSATIVPGQSIAFLSQIKHLL